jgi:hypothetical protein
VGLPLHRVIDLPLFLAANVLVDFEPLLVMTFKWDAPLHGHFHTLLIGGLVGLVGATAAFPFRRAIQRGMHLIRLPYTAAYWKMALSGILGAWLHVLFDAVLYHDVKPFFPWEGNPFLGIVSSSTVVGVCTVAFVPALILYGIMALTWKKPKDWSPSKR